MCSRTYRTLCSDNNCELCFNTSFASHSKSVNWSSKNKLLPRQVFKNSHTKFWFKCNKSGHEFESNLYNINNGRWCNYPCCGSKKLCNENCEICYNASFASHSKSIFWSDKNKLDPRQVFKSSNKKFWFKCDRSNHEFEVTLGSIVADQWCPYSCCTKQAKILCLDEECNICFNASFASNLKSKFWSDKNNLNSRSVFKSSNKKYWFKCENNHEFETSLDNVTNGDTWCPYCSIWKNQKECLKIIEQIAEKEFKQIRPKFLQGLELDGYNSELQLAIEYNGVQHYKYIPFFHNNDKENLIKQQERDKLKQELCSKNNIYLIIVPYWTTNKKELIQEEYQKYLTKSKN